MTVSPPADRPLWLVCEDGHEYIDRMQRFLGTDFRFAPASDAGALLRLAAAGDAEGAILDLDFRRTPVGDLIDDAGRSDPALDVATGRRLAETQGILILRSLRAVGSALPALLCADIDDPLQVSYLESTLAPLSVVGSRESLVQIAARMRAVGKAGRP